MSIKLLLTGGRAPVTLDLARQLHCAGYELYMAESEAVQLCRTSKVFKAQWLVTRPNQDAARYVQDVLDLCVSHQISQIIPMCEETFHLAAAKHKFEQHGIQLFTSDLQTLHTLHHKYAFIEYARSLGASVPDTWLVTSEEQCREARRELGERCIVKPAYSRFNTHVYALDPADSMPTALSITSCHPWVVQQFKHGRQMCTYSVAQEGNVVAHSCYATVFAIRGGATIHWQAVEHEAIEQFVCKLVSELKYTGQIAFDFIEQEDGQWTVIECNPRATSGIHLFRGVEAFAHLFVSPNGANSSVERVRPQRKQVYQLTSLMLLYGWHQRGFGRALRQARDVIWDKQDWRPALDQFRIMGMMMWRSLRTGKTVTELTTVDIEWSGEQ